MVFLGVLIAIGSAVLFVAVGALCVWGGADASRTEVSPGFLPDRPNLTQRALTWFGVWMPILVVLLLCLLAGAQIVRVAFQALG
jgi:hypothetical protein